MDITPILAGGAAVGLLASFWGKIKAVSWRLISILIQRVEIPSEAAHDALVAYLALHYRRSRTYDRMYGAAYEHQRDGHFGLVPFEQLGHRSVVFWEGWRPFVFSNEQENKARSGKGQPNDSSGDAAKVYSTLTFIRGTMNVENLVKRACSYRNELTWAINEADDQSRNRFVIHHVPKHDDNEPDGESGSSGLPWYRQASFRLLSHSPDQLGKARTQIGKALDNLIFPRRVKSLIEEIGLWRASRKWYRERGIPWKRGWLLYGPPGTGKTALARAFAEDLNMPIYVLNLAEMGNHDLLKAWNEMQVNVPCIALLEDFDNVFHGREYVARKHTPMPLFIGKGKDEGNERGGMPLAPLTFDCLLNCLDGVERCDGIFTIITTNDLSKIDPALGLPRRLPDGSVEFISTRPGRIDKAVELSYMELEDRKRLARRILSDYPAQLSEMLDFVDRYPELQETPAQFQERCAQIALACFWKQQTADRETLEGKETKDRERSPRNVACETAAS